MMSARNFRCRMTPGQRDTAAAFHQILSGLPPDDHPHPGDQALDGRHRLSQDALELA